jgi:regulator of sigma E protease
MLITLLIFLFILSVLIMAHELGHFLMAKRAGIQVEEFGIGYPPRVWSKKIGKTVYSINLLPIGGFVRLLGEEGPEEGECFLGKI